MILGGMGPVNALQTTLASILLLFMPSFRGSHFWHPLAFWSHPLCTGSFITFTWKHQIKNRIENSKWSGVERMLLIKIIEARFQNLSPDLLDVVLELRNIIAQIAPGVTEESMYSGMVYYMAERGGHVSAGVCLSVFTRSHSLHFSWGIPPDPDHLLRGNQVAMRDLNIRRMKPPLGIYPRFIEASYRFDPTTDLSNGWSSTVLIFMKSKSL